MKNHFKIDPNIYCCFDYLFNRFAHSAGPFYFGCLLGGLSGCCLCVCPYVRSIVEASCAHFGSQSWGILGSILRARGVAWAPFWGLWAALGIHIGGLGAPLGFIFGALGILWRLWGSLGAPLADQGAQSQIFPLFSLPFWAHFSSILEVQIDKKSDVIFH